MKRQYSIFIKMGRGYGRLSKLHGDLEEARRKFQTLMLSGIMVGLDVRLRPVRDQDSPMVNPDAVRIFNKITTSTLPIPE